MYATSFARTADLTWAALCVGVLAIGAAEVASGQNPDRERGGYSSYSVPIERGTRSIGPAASGVEPPRQTDEAANARPDQARTEQRQQTEPIAGDVETAGVADQPE